MNLDIKEYKVVLPARNALSFLAGDQYIFDLPLRQEIVNWLLTIVGCQCVSMVCAQVSESEPWRHRRLVLGSKGSEIFFFHSKKQARMFSLVWGQDHVL